MNSYCYIKSNKNYRSYTSQFTLLKYHINCMNLKQLFNLNTSFYYYFSVCLFVLLGTFLCIYLGGVTSIYKLVFLSMLVTEIFNINNYQLFSYTLNELF